jgi:ketosteroid isomerase-like protein
MSEENVQTLRHTVDAFNRGDWDEARLDFDTSGEWPPAEPGPEETSYFSYEGIRNYFQSWTDSFDNFRLEIMELIDAGDHVFVVVQVRGQGRQSGEETSSPLHPLIAQFEEGKKILGLTLFMSREAALQAAGLSDQDTQK